MYNKNKSIKSFHNFAFFESYFSNYIEGTVFEVDEAKKIIETNKPLSARNENSHDVPGISHIVSNIKEMSKVKLTPNRVYYIRQSQFYFTRCFSSYSSLSLSLQ